MADNIIHEITKILQAYGGKLVPFDFSLVHQQVHPLPSGIDAVNHNQLEIHLNHRPFSYKTHPGDRRWLKGGSVRVTIYDAGKLRPGVWHKEGAY